MRWKEIKNKEDISFLMKEYSCFHDSCIVSINYISGAYVDLKGSMHGIDNNCSLTVRMESQEPEIYNHPGKKTLEMKFTGLRRLCLAGYQNNYFCDIFSCYLSFYKDFILWSDDGNFDPENYRDSILSEFMVTFIIADRLFWRFKA